MKDRAPAAPSGSASPGTVTTFPALERQAATPMFGRSVEQAELLETLRSHSARLVTLTGRGGVGKTRLAVEVMRVLSDEPEWRIVGVALAGVAGAEMVLGEIAAAIGLAHLPSVDVADVLAAHIRDDEVLLVLDNFEHVLPAAPVSGELLGRCPNTRILVTSQAPLRLRLEQVRRLEPLPVPEPGESNPELLLQGPSVAAYCERAAAVDSGFELHEGNAGAVAELCRKLEGLPLAIELAAARAATLPAAEILRRLDTAGLDVLRRRLGDAPERHHDLRRAIEWTYQLVASGEQHMLRRISVISGTFDLDAVEALSSPIASADAIDQLAALVDVHLVDPIPGSDPARFQMPSSIRTFSRDELERTGEHESVRVAHLAMRACEARDVARGVESEDEAAWLNTLRADHDDLVAALETALTLECPDEAIDLAAGLLPLWNTRGYYVAEEQLVERALNLGDAAGAASIAYVNVLLWSALLGLQQGATVGRDALLARMRRGEALARELDHTATLLRAPLAYRMLAVPYTGNVADAKEASDEGLELADRANEQRWLGRIEAWSGMLATLMGEDERAVVLGRSAVTRARRDNDQRTLVIATMMLMPLRRKYPEIAPDVPPTEEALRCARATGLVLYEGLLLAMMVGDAVADHDARGARRWAAEALTVARSMPGSPVVGYNLMMMLSVAATCGDDDMAAYFYGSVRDDIAALSLNMSATQLAAHDRILARSRAALGPEVFDAQVRRGETIAPAAAIDDALAYVHKAMLRFDDEQLLATTAESNPGVRLTGRQQEVLFLIVAGFGNREIAATLGISTKTAMHHTTAIYRTLGVRGRSEAIALALRTGLVE